jgi:amino acid adenylation domain-containing protein
MDSQHSQYIFPLTRNQREIYFEQLLHANTSIFNIGATTTIDGPFQPELFVRAVRHLYHFHPEPNATIFEENGTPLQRLALRKEFSPAVIDFSQLANPEQEAAAYIERHFQEPLPFGPDAPLSAMMVFIINPRRHIWYSKFHHIIWDGWSLSILYLRIVEEYNRLIKGEPDLPPNEFRFEKFIAVDEQYAASEAAQKDRRYWEEKFITAPRPYYPLKKAFSYDRGHQVLVLPRRKFEQLTQLARQENCSSFHFMIAVLFASLAEARQTGDLRVALPILNRRTRAFKETMGLFINVLPLRMHVDPRLSFRALLRQIALQLAQDYRHSRFAVGPLVRKREAALMGQQHLAEISFSYENLIYERDFAGCRNRVTTLNTRQQVRPLQVFLREYDKREDAYLDFNHNLSFIDRDRMQEMVGRFDESIHQYLSNPDAAICEQKHSPVKEQNHMTAGAPMPAANLVSMFEQQAALHPHRTAVSFEETHLTYHQLNSRANQLARLLRSRHISQEHIVGLCLDRSPELIISMLAILKAGAAYLPLDPRYPTQRLSFLLLDSHPQLVITHSTAAHSLPDDTTRQLLLDELKDELDTFSEENLLLEIDPRQAAYIIYTSGSTGEPKGCIVTHHNVTRLMRATEEQFSFSEQDVWTLFHSASFDFSVWEVWGALLYGGRLVIVDYWTTRSPDSFYELLAREQVTVLNQTPSAFRQLMEVEAQAGEHALLEAKALPELSLRLVIFGGEALDLPSLRPWFSRHGDERPQLVNMYGITETTVHVTHRVIRQSDCIEGRASLIGEPISDVQLHLLDEGMRRVPVGVRGEIYVGGAGVGRGYWERAELTAERFVPDPFGSEPGQRLYRSGDVGRRRADGELEYLGRADQQVKVRGYRIELGEIEAAVSEHHGVSASVVLATGRDGAEKRLVCYVSRRAGVEPVSVEELRRHVAERLPEHMMPAAFVMLEELPLNENGKVDRRALAEVERGPEREEAEEEKYEEAENEREEQLVQIWREVLGVERVGRADNFFGLGGDSILALQVAAKARRHGFEITFKEIYEQPTIRALAMLHGEFIPNESARDFAAARVGLNDADFARLPADAEDAFPLSSLQAGMLYHSERSPQSAIFHDIFSFQLEVAWNETAWRKALDQLSEAHAVLRTSFDLGSYSEAIQIVHRAVKIPCAVTDIRQDADEAQQHEINRWIEREKACPFSFKHAPLLRVHVHLLKENRIQLTISFHHAVLDGWSVATLVTQLFLLYMGVRKSLAIDKSNVFRTFIYAEREALASEALRQFWTEQLKSMPSVRLANPNHLKSRGEVKRHSITISTEFNERLVELSQRCSVPLKTVLLAAHLKALSRSSGQAQAVTGYVTHGRPESAEVETLGLFLNTLPFSVPEVDSSWIEFVHQVFLKEKELLSNRSYPLASIKQLNHGQLPFDVGFNYVQFHVYNALRAIEGLKVLDFQVYEETDFPLLAQFTRHPWSLELELTLVYDSQHFTETQIARITDSYLEIFKSMTGEPLAHTSPAVSSGHGKLNRYMLPAPSLSDMEVPYVPPANETQKKLALIYEEVLDVQPVGIRHNFFELGGNSILAARLVSRIRHVFQTDLALNLLFENPDIERLATYIPEAVAPRTATATPTIARAHRKLATIKISGGE